MIAASAGAVPARWVLPSRQTIRTSFMSRTPPPGNPPTAEKHLPAGKARRAATITSASGSIATNGQIIALSSDQGATHQRERRRRPGAVGIISRPRSFITSPPTTVFLIGCTARSRKVVLRPRSAAATTARSRFVTGGCSAWKNTARLRSIRSTKILFTAHVLRAPISN